MGKAYLLHRTKGMPTSDLIAPAADTSRLLEQVASEPNLATALLNVARNKGALAWTAKAWRRSWSSAPHLLPDCDVRCWTGTTGLATSAGFGFPNLGEVKGAWEFLT